MSLPADKFCQKNRTERKKHKKIKTNVKIKRKSKIKKPEKHEYFGGFYWLFNKKMLFFKYTKEKSNKKESAVSC